MEVILRCEGYEELWRNVISATLDKDLWPELSSTPVAIRLWMKGLKAIPFIGHRLWKSTVEPVLKAQLLMIFERHKYMAWCGHVPITDWWPTPLFEREPQWIQNVEWENVELCNKIATWAARVLSGTLLGLSDGYSEYHRPRTSAINPEKSPDLEPNPLLYSN